MDAGQLVAEHEAAGRVVDAGGVGTFVREQGEGPAVLLVHGVPVSSFVWRRLVRALADRELRAVAPDLPGTGLSARPERFDYTWTGLGRHLAGLVDALGLAEFHLVVHDIGGPVGFEVAAAMPERVRSITVLDTIVAPHTFRKPPPMAPFAVPGLGELSLRATPRAVFRALVRRVGLLPGTAVTDAEIDAHHLLLRRGDNGRAFLRIMRSFETAAAKTELYSSVLAPGHYPVQVLWGEDDPALTARRHGLLAAQAAGIGAPLLLPGRHFLMEDSAGAVADAVHRLATQR